MWLCNFCAAGTLTTEALIIHWQRGMKVCGYCKKNKSCQSVDEEDKTLWKSKFGRYAKLNLGDE